MSTEKSPRVFGQVKFTPEERAAQRLAASRRDSALASTVSLGSRKHIESVPPGFRRRALFAAAGEASLKQAIRAKCEECVGYEDVSERIRTCTVSRCALLAYRPYQTKESSDCTDAAEQTEGEIA